MPPSPPAARGSGKRRIRARRLSPADTAHAAGAAGSRRSPAPGCPVPVAASPPLYRRRHRRGPGAAGTAGTPTTCSVQDDKPRRRRRRRRHLPRRRDSCPPIPPVPPLPTNNPPSAARYRRSARTGPQPAPPWPNQPALPPFSTPPKPAPPLPTMPRSRRHTRARRAVTQYGAVAVAVARQQTTVGVRRGAVAKEDAERTARRPRDRKRLRHRTFGIASGNCR